MRRSTTRAERLVLALTMILALAGCSEHRAADPSQAATRAEAALSPADRPAFRVARLSAYLRAARLQPSPDEAAALANQGMVEAYDGEPGAFQGLPLDEAKLRRAAQTGKAVDLDAALDTLASAQTAAGGDKVAVARALAALSAALYAAARNGEGIDALECKDSLGMALAAQALAGDDHAKADLANLVSLWPQAQPPPNPAPVGMVRAAADKAVKDLR